MQRPAQRTCPLAQLGLSVFAVLRLMARNFGFSNVVSADTPAVNFYAEANPAFAAGALAIRRILLCDVSGVGKKKYTSPILLLLSG